LKLNINVVFAGPPDSLRPKKKKGRRGTFVSVYIVIIKCDIIDFVDYFACYISIYSNIRRKVIITRVSRTKR